MFHTSCKAGVAWFSLRRSDDKKQPVVINPVTFNTLNVILFTI